MYCQTKRETLKLVKFGNDVKIINQLTSKLATILKNYCGWELEQITAEIRFFLHRVL